MKHEQVIYGSVPNDWRSIPEYSSKYKVNISGQVWAYYEYEGHNRKPHYKLLSGNNGNYVLTSGRNRSKFCIDYLLDLCFGIQHIQLLEDEIWKPIRGYEGLYQISNYGRILSERRFITRKNGYKQFCKEQIVQSKTIINSGYRVVHLIRDKKAKHFLVHRLVAEHFIENPNNLMEVNHKDENKLNNVVSNLEWCNRSCNQRYGTCQERRKATRIRNNNGSYGYKRKTNR